MRKKQRVRNKDTDAKREEQRVRSEEKEAKRQKTKRNMQRERS